MKWMKVMKRLGILTAAYVVLVLLFDGVFISLNQAKLERSKIPMLHITTMDSSGAANRRQLARFESNGKLYVSAHHWWRGWYHRALANPQVQVEINGVSGNYRAVPVAGAEFEQVAKDFQLGFLVRFLMGFPPPRDILRLDPAR